MTRPGPASGGALRRVLIYSHDTFGLGHLRRARAIAHALVAEAPERRVLILSGSPVSHAFRFAPGVACRRLPGVVKLESGAYRSLGAAHALDAVVATRAALIRHVVRRFDPDLFLVDKEPTGFHGEVLPVLGPLKARGCRLVLGLRDVLDDPALLAPEWERKGALGVLPLYDSIWIYGLPEIYAPLSGLSLPAGVDERLTYTGYLRREAPEAGPAEAEEEPFLLVTPGGGGDGVELVEAVVRAYEARAVPHRALVVFGPFFPPRARDALQARIDAHPRLSALDFDARLERLMRRAAGVVAMGGYNTFCEILSFDRPALILPRVRPRREQLIRAEAAARLGLVETLAPDRADPERMAAALAALPGRPRPSARPIPGLLGGLPAIRGLAQAACDAACMAAE
ncbi:glycosyltransferase family protein [Methylobacterium sp. ID0610]|uniref:glycosyltransferase family protein n=1 Tax=Methylobacterium carpenticola TaxID=3344827 RepID=UPI0036B5A5C6